MKNLLPTQIKAFQKTVWDYYQKHKRPMPWRSRVSAYRVLISEVMLQQTQVDRVIPKFKAWMKQFPNFQALAKASTRDVLQAWNGLGYNRRALALHNAAKAITTQYAGRLPRTPEELDALPGIGPATAASILVYAYNLPYPFIETNVRTVYIHHFFSSAAAVNDTEIFPLVQQTLDTKNPREWYWALMDYGTYLKKQHKNPSRHSAHYTKQSAFEGSNRQLRGAIVRELLHSSPLTVTELTKRLSESKQKVAPVVAQLIKDGFIHQSKNALHL